jgi:hypothetical protein
LLQDEWQCGSVHVQSKIPWILWHRRLGTTWIRIVWRDWSFLRASFAEEAARQVAGRDSGFCITMAHRATHRLLCSSSSPRKAFLSSPAIVLSRSRSEWLLAVPYSDKWASREHVSQPWRTSHEMQRPNSRRFQKKSSAGAVVCVLSSPALKVFR